MFTKVRLIVLSSIIIISGCFQGPALKGVKAVKTKVESTVTTVSSGTVEAEQEAILSFGIAGKINNIRVKLGDTVKKGQILASLENKDLEWISTQAAKELKRNEHLFKEGLISTSQWDEVQKNYQVAKSNFEKSQIEAPFDGLISELNLQMGEVPSGLANSKAPIRIVDFKPRIIRGRIDEMDLARVKVKDEVRVRIQSLGTQRLSAHVTKIIPFISTSKEQERTATVEIKLDDPKIIPHAGASADIEILVETKDQALAVPAKTILGTSKNRHVFKFEEGKLIKTKIETGIGNYESIEIKNGLNEGEIVVFPSDNFELIDGMKAKVDTEIWPSSK